MYKILAIANDNYGCGKFRTFDPFKCIAENYSDEFEVKTMLINELPNDMNQIIELFQKFDMLHFHKAMDIHLNLLHIAKQLGLLVVADVDDHWNLGEFHPLANTAKRENWAKPVIEHITNADYVTATTEYLANEVRKYNKNVFVIPNAVNPDEEQFKPDFSTSNRLRFGVICGSSHLYDLKEMEGFVKQLPKEILNQCQFLLCGFDTSGRMTIYDKDTNTYKQVPINPEECVWGKYEKIMTDNYNIVSPLAKQWLTKYIQMPFCGDDNYVRCWTKNINSYATHYNNIDVLLVPLKECQFNLAKCVTANTKVNTNKGIFTIKELFDDALKYNVIVDNQQKPIVNFFKSENIDTIKIETEYGYEIECSEHHKLIVNDKWTEMSEVKKGDKVKLEFPEISELDISYLDDLKLDEDMMYIIGCMFGYYHLNKHGFAISNLSTNIIDEDVLIKILEDKNLISKNTIEGSNIDIIKTSYGSKNYIIKKTFSKLSNKYKDLNFNKLPNFVFKCGKNCLLKFIEGFKKYNIGKDGILTFKRKNVLKDFQYLLLCDKTLSQKETDYKLRILDVDKSDSIEIEDSIKTISHGNNTVYDIEVEDIHMYNGNGFVSHNSQLKVIEAGFKHKAIIAEEVGPYKLDLNPMIKKGGEIDETGNALLVNPSKTHKQWAKYITYLVKNRDKVKLLQDNLYNTVKDTYNLKNVTKERVKFYKEILDKHKNKN